MNILSLSLDPSILDPKSKTATRISRFGGHVSAYNIVVPSTSHAMVELGQGVMAHGSGGLLKIGRLVRTYVLAKKLLRAGHYDVVTVQDVYFLGSAARRLSRIFDIGFEIQIHGFEKYHGVRKWLTRRNITRADHVRVVSERLAREIVAEYAIDPAKITVIPVYTEIKTAICPPKKDVGFTFLTVSRLVPIKNIALQLEALEIVRKTHPETRLVVVGDGPLRHELESYARKLKLETAVSFEGKQSDLAPYYCNADAFLLTSNREGWGMVVVEAAHFGLPSIMTDVGCAGEFIINDQSGIIVPLGGKNELIRAMQSLIESEGLRTRLGNNARQAALALPSFEQAMKRSVEGWQKCVAVHNSK